MREPCLTDEMLIDLLLSRVPVELNEQAQKHLKFCHACQERSKEWQQLVGVGTVTARSARGLSWRYTAPKLKKRLKAKIIPSKSHSTMLSKPTVMLLSISLLICLTVWAGLWPLTEQHHQENLESEALSPAAQQVQAITPDTRFLINPQTTHYRIHHTITVPINENFPPAHQVQGHLWVAPQGQQIFMVLEGLYPLPEKDYQVWVISREMASSAGLVNLYDSNAVLYWHNDQPADIDMIRISIEPKGGSFIPSGPEALLIPLRH